MTTSKPLQNSKPKRPIYYDEAITVYNIVKVKARADHNAADALEELKQQLQIKKPKKNGIKAEEEALKFKKKLALGPSKLDHLPYSAIKAFYQFSISPASIVLGVGGKGIPKHYMFLATPSEAKANKLAEVLQEAQWVPDNNLKNEKPEVIIKGNSLDNSLITENYKAPEYGLPAAPKPSNAPTRKSSIPDRSPGPVEKPVDQSRHTTSSHTESVSSISYANQKKQTKLTKDRSGHQSSTVSPQRIEYQKSHGKRRSDADQIPVGYANENSSYVSYKPGKKSSGPKSPESTRSANYYAPENSMVQRSPSKAKLVGGGVFITASKPDKLNKTTGRRAASENRLASNIYYVRPDVDETSSSSSISSSNDSLNENYIIREIFKPTKIELSRSRRHSSSSSSSYSYSSSNSLSPGRLIVFGHPSSRRS